MPVVDLTIPDIGSFKDVPVIEILVKAGDEVEVDQPLMTLESDKATMEVPSTVAGTVREVVVKVGDRVSRGTLVARIEGAEAQSAPAIASTTRAATRQPAGAPAVPSPAPPLPVLPSSRQAVEFPDVLAGPGARRLARELGLDLQALTGTGEHGRITREDIKAALSHSNSAGSSARLPPVPAIDYAHFGPIETVPLSRIRRISGPRLHASWLNIPHVTHCDEADITDLEPFRKRLDAQARHDKAAPYRVSLLPFLLRAAVATLKAFPPFNAALNPTGDALLLRHYWHVGVAVDTPEGLLVPVLRDVDRKGVLEIARELVQLSGNARAGTLAPSDMQGATFTVSSLGGIGGTAFTPIIDAPQVAVLGAVRAKIMPVWDGEAFRPRLVLPLCLSYDHRVIDGAQAARFMRHLSANLEDVRRLIL